MKIAIDFDGTCVDHLFPIVGESVPHAVEVMKRLQEKGDRLILNTMRDDRYLEDALAWFAENEIILYGIQTDPDQQHWTRSRKCFANAYIDDLAIGCPLIHPPGFSRPCVDWLAVERLLQDSERLRLKPKTRTIKRISKTAKNGHKRR